MDNKPTPAALAAATPTAPAPTSSKRRIVAIASVLALAALGLGGRMVYRSHYFAETDDAYLSGHVHPISARIPGVVSKVLVQDNQYVHAGDVLAELDPADQRVRLEQIEAQVAQAQQQLAQADAQIAQARASASGTAAQVIQSQATLTRTQQDASRLSELYNAQMKAISKAELDAAVAARASAAADLQARKDAVGAAQAQVSAAQASRKVMEAQIKVLQTQAKDAQLQLGYNRIVAPVDGRVGKRDLELGQRIQPGQQIAAIVQDEVWVQANFKETQLAGLVPGQDVEVKVDALPGEHLVGKLDSFSPASGNQFSLLPADNATGNFTKIVQRIPVKVTFSKADRDRLAGRLAPGMSAIVEIDLRQAAPGTATKTAKRTLRPTTMAASNSAALAPMLADPSAKVDLRTWLAVAAGLLGAFMAVLDIQITNASLKDILGTLSATQDEGSWISTAYLCAEIVVIPLTALLARVLGLRSYMVSTTALFLICSTLCGAAWNLPSMIVFRMMQGFTGGALIPMAMTLVMAKLPPSKRAVGLAMFGLTATMAPTLGPTLGGYLTDIYGWPSIFYVNWVPGLLLIGGILWGLDPEPRNWKLLRTADWIGISFMAVGLASLTIFLEEGNSHDWFASPFILRFAALAFVGIVGWILISLLRPEPFVNVRLYGQRNFFVAVLLAATTGMALYGSSFLLPLYLGQIAGYTPMQIGEVIMWSGLPQLFIMPVVAQLSTRVDNRILCSIGLAMFGVSCLMNANMTALTGYDQLLWSQIVRALGQPFIMLTLSNFAMQGISPKDTPSASSLFNMTRNLGGSVGLALLATMLSTREQLHSARLGEAVTMFSEATRSRLDAFGAAFTAKGMDPAMASQQALGMVDRITRREAYVLAYNDAFLIMAAVLFGCIVILWLADGVKSPGGGNNAAH